MITPPLALGEEYVLVASAGAELVGLRMTSAAANQAWTRSVNVTMPYGSSQGLALTAATSLDTGTATTVRAAVAAVSADDGSGRVEAYDASAHRSVSVMRRAKTCDAFRHTAH